MNVSTQLRQAKKQISNLNSQLSLVESLANVKTKNQVRRALEGDLYQLENKIIFLNNKQKEVRKAK